MQADFVRHFVGDRHHAARVVRQGRGRHQNQMIAVLQAAHDFGDGLAPLILAEKFLDVLNLERTLFERILRNSIFHF